MHEFKVPYGLPGDDPDMYVGRSVHFNADGKLDVGGGTSIYKSIHAFGDVAMKHIGSCAFGEDLVLLAYDGYIEVILPDADGFVSHVHKVSIAESRRRGGREGGTVESPAGQGRYSGDLLGREG